ncbi:MAG: hypothetical protein AMJ45_01040 [Syntrophobacter sp. DG_60]|nr:MAG: hypothetical protein AMJ45_01040 [Syntrophobacter sp. DG_60]
MKAKGIWAIAVITFKEGIRSRLFVAILVLASLVLVLIKALSDLAIGNTIKVALDIGFASIDLFGLLLAFLLTTTLIAKDLDKKTIYLVISKPITRSDYLTGKFLGLITIFSLALLAVGLLFFLSFLYTLKTTHLYQMPEIYWARILLAYLFIFLKVALITALALFFSSLTTSSLLAIFLTFMVYLIGQSVQEIKNLLVSPLAAELSPVIKSLAHLATYVFPNLSLFDFKATAIYGLPLSTDAICLNLFYGLLYLLGIFLLAQFIFRFKEF